MGSTKGLEEYENFKKNGYWQKTCLNCKHRETIVNYGRRVDFFFNCKYLNTTVLSVNLTWNRKANNCDGWTWAYCTT